MMHSGREDSAMIRQLDDTTMVSGQLTPDQVADLKAQGVTLLVNNRPDNEDPDQPLSSDMEAAARAAGLEYRHIPIRYGIGPSDVESMRDAMHAAGDGKLLAFCRSGNRSALAWAVARAEDGAEPEELHRCAEAAGFNLGPVAHLL
jgi:uncharacterized protein (TIGR01244 family)